VRFAFEVGIPEWPSAALERADGIDRTHGFAVVALEENAIAAGFFGEAVSQADAPKLFSREPAVVVT
jgi:hypothetical protein